MTGSAQVIEHTQLPMCGLFPTGFFLPLLLIMQPRLDLFRIPLVVELQQAREHLAAGRVVDGVADALLGFVEAVAQVQIGQP